MVMILFAKLRVALFMNMQPDSTRFCIFYKNQCYDFIFMNIVTKFREYMEHWMNMTPWKDQTDLINGFDFIRKIEGSVSYEHVAR